MKQPNCPLCEKQQCACDQQNTEKLPSITAEQLHTELSTNNNLLVINVLPSEYYKDCHIPNSINLPFDQFKERATQLDRNKKIVVYCASYLCTASSGAFKMLRSMGFKNIVVYEGGTKEWRDKGFLTEGACKLPYLTAPN